MGCIRRKQVEQRTEPVPSTVPGETEEEQDPEPPHSVQNLQALHAAPNKPSEHRRVLWPATHKGTECIGAERFSIKQPKAKNTARPNQHETKISQLRKELKALKQQYRKASEEERPALTELWNILRQKLISLLCAEWHRRRGRERAHERTAFIANPFGFTKQLLGQKWNGTLFNTREPTLAEVRDTVRAAQTSAAPGLSGVPYKAYKHCLRLLERLWRLIRVVWRRGRAAKQWRHAEGVWIPKEKDANDITQFRTISLLNVEGKIFFKILANWLTEYLLRNSCIDTTVQKGGVPGMPGCLEHTGVVTQLIREAREN
ncbi:hypothetical protein LDENG_00212670 [Lucifuga dentata]|nr:hypothetical protein LDENG_00212670 [Lucifuga dentata]